MCNFFLTTKNRRCLRSPSLEYCFQHKKIGNVESKEEEKVESKEEEKVESKEEEKVESKEDCAICLSECLEKTICGHSVHTTCIMKWKNMCPLCRREDILPKKLKKKMKKKAKRELIAERNRREEADFRFASQMQQRPDRSREALLAQEQVFTERMRFLMTTISETRDQTTLTHTMESLRDVYARMIVNTQLLENM